MAFKIVVDKEGVPYKVNKNETPPVKKENIIAAITINGQHMVLINKSRDLFNPRGDNHKSIGNKRVKPKLVRCNKVCYEYFIMYLHSKNRTHYDIARRELQNG
jgi:hypothetical protein